MSENPTPPMFLPPAKSGYRCPECGRAVANESIFCHGPPVEVPRS